MFANLIIKYHLIDHNEKLIPSKSGISLFIGAAFSEHYKVFKRFNSFLILISSCSAIPRRGIEPWSLILCKFKDLAQYEPRDREWFGRWLNGQSGQGFGNEFLDLRQSSQLVGCRLD